MVLHSGNVEKVVAQLLDARIDVRSSSIPTSNRSATATNCARRRSRSHRQVFGRVQPRAPPAATDRGVRQAGHGRPGREKTRPGRLRRPRPHLPQHRRRGMIPEIEELNIGHSSSPAPRWWARRRRPRKWPRSCARREDCHGEGGSARAAPHPSPLPSAMKPPWGEGL